MARTTTKETPLWVAISSGTFKVDGRLMSYHRGQVVGPDYPLLKVRPEAFQPVRVERYERPVEQMTAAPGEQRGVA